MGADTWDFAVALGVAAAAARASVNKPGIADDSADRNQVEINFEVGGSYVLQELPLLLLMKKDVFIFV